MKKLALKKYIKEQIVNALSEVTIVDKKTKPNEAPEIAKREDKEVETVTQAIRTAQQTNKPVTIAEKEEDDVEVEDNWYKSKDEDDIKPVDAPAGDKNIQKKATKQDIIIKTYKDLNQILQRYRTAYDNAKNETDKQEAFQLLKKFSQSQEWKDAKEKYTKITNIKL
jgi:hypothetical protein